MRDKRQEMGEGSQETGDGKYRRQKTRDRGQETENVRWEILVDGRRETRDVIWETRARR